MQPEPKPSRSLSHIFLFFLNPKHLDRIGTMH